QRWWKVHADADEMTGDGEEMTGDGEEMTGDIPDGTKLAPAPRRRLVGRLRRMASKAIPSSVLVRRGAVSGKRVALTFDDGPHEMTDRYLEVLERFGARATFFLVGKACVARRADLLRIVARGHEVAAHGFTHTPFPSLDGEALVGELRRTASALPPQVGRPLLRPPRGATSMRSLAICAAHGYQTVMWSRDAHDCPTRS